MRSSASIPKRPSTCLRQKPSNSLLLILRCIEKARHIHAGPCLAFDKFHGIRGVAGLRFEPAEHQASVLTAEAEGIGQDNFDVQ